MIGKEMGWIKGLETFSFIELKIARDIYKFVCGLMSVDLNLVKNRKVGMGLKKKLTEWIGNTSSFRYWKTYL